MKVVIAGGGVIGAAIAYHLETAGADTVLLERGEFGGEASGAAAGMLIPPLEDTRNRKFNDLRRASLALYPRVIEEVQRLSGVDVEYKMTGMLRTAARPEMVKALKAAARRKNSGLEWLDPPLLAELEPALSPRLLGAAYSEGDADVNPGALANAFAQAAGRLGADLRPRTMLTGFLRPSSFLRTGGGRTVEGLSTNLGDIRDVDAVVIAAGPWTEPLLMRLGVQLRTPPVRGQMLAYRSKLLRHAIWGEDGYLVPKTGGFIFAGATVEDVGFRKATTARALAGLRSMAAALAPGLRAAEVVSAWAGLRPGSADGLPVIGRVPGRDNVYVATGHLRNGILLAPITGKLLCELMMTGRADRLLKPFGPERFVS